MVVTPIVFHRLNGLLNTSHPSKVPDKLVTPLTFQLFTIPLKLVQFLNIFSRLVTCERLGDAIASKFKFSQP